MDRGDRFALQPAGFSPCSSPLRLYSSSGLNACDRRCDADRLLSANAMTDEGRPTPSWRSMVR